jgi:integrase
MAKPIQLKAVEHNKRATKDIPIFLDDKLYGNLEEIIKATAWDYKSNFRAAFLMRDRALVALLILTGVRISEALRLKRKQFRIYKDYILLVNVETLKHGLLRKEIVLPKQGSLAPFTAIFEAWLTEIPEKEEEAFMFPTGTVKGFHVEQPLTRYRANRIMKQTTGKFPHWFRAVCENLYGKKVFNNNAYKLKDFMGLVNIESTTPYVQADWTEDKEKIFKL